MGAWNALADVLRAMCKEVVVLLSRWGEGGEEGWPCGGGSCCAGPLRHPQPMPQPWNQTWHGCWGPTSHCLMCA
jgi:hypothetical protein